MELELLKQAWSDLDKKMKSTELLNEKLIENIIASRSMATIDKLKKIHNGYYFVLVIELIFLTAILIGNPFDFISTWQFIPYVLLLIGIVMAFRNLKVMDRFIHQLSPENNIGDFLQNIVIFYDKNKVNEKWFGISMLSIGLLVPISFLPNKIANLGIQQSLIDISIMTATTLCIYLLAFKLNLFRNPYKDSFEKNLNDWKELRTMAQHIDHNE